MRKVPTLFVRDMTTKLVTPDVTPGCEWVINGEGVATEKIDGTCCLVRDGKLYKRYDAKAGRTPPQGFEPAQDAPDEHTGHWPGWVAVGDGPDDKWHREAWTSDRNPPLSIRNPLQIEGTWELIGPKVQGNPYGLESHQLVRHGDPWSFYDEVAPHLSLSFDEVRDFLARYDIEGLVWHHPDMRMAKVKRRDFNLPWPQKVKA